jgi:hypothetical protein
MASKHPVKQIKHHKQNATKPQKQSTVLRTGIVSNVAPQFNQFPQGTTKSRILYEEIGTMTANSSANANYKTQPYLNAGNDSMGSTGIIQINPGLSTFPMKSTEASVYNRWRLTGDVILTFTSTVTDYGALSGEVIASYNPDAADSPVFDVRVFNDFLNNRCKPSEHMQLRIPLSKLGSQWRYVRRGATAAGEDVRLYDAGWVILTNYGTVAPSGVTLSSIGRWHVHIPCEYDGPFAPLVASPPSVIPNTFETSTCYVTTGTASVVAAATPLSLFTSSVSSGIPTFIGGQFLGASGIANAVFDANALLDPVGGTFDLPGGEYEAVISLPLQIVATGQIDLTVASNVAGVGQASVYKSFYNYTANSVSAYDFIIPVHVPSNSSSISAQTTPVYFTIVSQASAFGLLSLNTSTSRLPYIRVKRLA